MNFNEIESSGYNTYFIFNFKKVPTRISLSIHFIRYLLIFCHRRMKYQKITGWTLCMLVLCSTIINTAAYPQNLLNDELLESSRRYAEKPNNVKKVALDDIDQDIQTNQISDNPFSWTNMLGSYWNYY